MFDNQLIALLIQTIAGQETIAGIPGLEIAASYQPTQQGVSTNPIAFIYKVGDLRVGWPYRSDIWDSGSSTMVHSELQQYETTFQMSALSIQNPATPSAKTASDILNLIAYILQSSTTIAILEAQGVGIKKIFDIRNPYFLDDRQRNEASPSFDFTVTHKQIITSTAPILQDTELNIITI